MSSVDFYFNSHMCDKYRICRIACDSTFIAIIALIAFIACDKCDKNLLDMTVWLSETVWGFFWRVPECFFMTFANGFFFQYCQTCFFQPSFLWPFSFLQCTLLRVFKGRHSKGRASGSVTAKIKYCVKLILRMCLYVKSILHKIVTE